VKFAKPRDGGLHSFCVLRLCSAGRSDSIIITNINIMHVFWITDVVMLFG
jgi:hypothetical protein